MEARAPAMFRKTRPSSLRYRLPLPLSETRKQPVIVEALMQPCQQGARLWPGLRCITAPAPPPLNSVSSRFWRCSFDWAGAVLDLNRIRHSDVKALCNDDSDSRIGISIRVVGNNQLSIAAPPFEDRCETMTSLLSFNEVCHKPAKSLATISLPTS